MSQHLPFPAERIAVVSITRHGIALAGRVVAALPGARLFAPRNSPPKAAAALARLPPATPARPPSRSPSCSPGSTASSPSCRSAQWSGWSRPTWQEESDPGVVVIDEGRALRDPMLSGHLGGANALAGAIATALDATPVLTTASDARQTLADPRPRAGLDLRGQPRRDRPRQRGDENDEPVALCRRPAARTGGAVIANGRSGPPPANLHPFTRLRGRDPPASAPCCGSATGAACRPLARLAGKRRPTGRRWRHERPIAIGLAATTAARRPATLVWAVVRPSAAAARPSPTWLRWPASTSRPTSLGCSNWPAGRAGRSALPGRRAGHRAGAPPVRRPSANTGTPRSPEAAALLAAGAGMDQLIVEKLPLPRPRRPQRHRFHRKDSPNERQNPRRRRRQDHAGRPGPGSHEHLTARARAAIAEADTVIGYVTYIRLVAELLEGKEVIKEVDDRGARPRHRSLRARPPGPQGGADLVRRRRRVWHGRADLRGALPGRWTPESGIEVEIIPGASASTPAPRWSARRSPTTSAPSRCPTC